MLNDEDLTELWPEEPLLIPLWERARDEYQLATGSKDDSSLFAGLINPTQWQARKMVCGGSGPYGRFCTRAKEHKGPHVSGPDDPNDWVSWVTEPHVHPRIGLTWVMRILEEHRG
jgi:hypothetical protein